MESPSFQFRAKVWLYPGETASWHFVNLPKKLSHQIKTVFGGLAGGWGSLPVTVTIGKTRWNTSIFPDKKSGSYLLPLKVKVRKAEGIAVGSTVSISTEVRV